MLETSVVAKAVASVVDQALITNEVEAVIVPTERIPSAAAPVAPTLMRVKTMMEFAVTAVVATVAVPPTKVTLPKEFAPALVVEATLVLMILFPAVPKTKFPFVAVIFPRVAVMLVPALTAPAVADILPVVAVTPVPPVTVVVAARDVVVVKEPGAVIAEGRERVTVWEAAAVVIWFAVPEILIVPAEGVAVPVSPVRPVRPAEEPPIRNQVSTPPDLETSK